MKQTKKLSLSDLKIKSFSTSLSKNEISFIKGGSNICVPGPVSENIACTSIDSGHPRCIK